MAERQRKIVPEALPEGFAVSPFNAVILALDSDAKGCKTNLFTLFSEAKARGESVREHEKGVPFLYYNWNKYVNRNNPDDVISGRHIRNCRNRTNNSTRE